MKTKTISVAVLLAATCSAADLKSGPDVGARVPKLKVFAATGTHEGKTLDYAADRKDKPTVYLLIADAKFDRPMARYMKNIDKDLAGGKEKAEIVAVWLTDQADAAKDRLPRIQQSLQMEATALTIYSEEKPGPKDWHVNDLAHITTIVANQGKVAAVFAHQSINETDATKTVTAVRKAVGGK